MSSGRPGAVGCNLSTNGNISGSTGFVGLVNVGWGFGNGSVLNSRETTQQRHGGFSNGNFRTTLAWRRYQRAEVRRYGQRSVRLQWRVALVVPYIGVGVGYVGITEKWHSNNNLGSGVPNEWPRYRGFPAGQNSVQGCRGRRTESRRALSHTRRSWRGLAASGGHAWAGSDAEYRFLGTTGHRSIWRPRSLSTRQARREPDLYDAGRVPAGARATTTPSCSASATTSASHRRLRRPGCGPGPGAGPLLPGVLRLGQGDAHRSRAPDHRRSGGQFGQGAVHADRGERLRRHLGHARSNQGLSVRRARAVQAELVGTACRRTRSRSRASATRICWCRPAQACASRRTAASRSSSADLPRGNDDNGSGRREAPLFVRV